MLSGIIMPLFNIPLNSESSGGGLPEISAWFSDRRLELCHRHAAVKPAVSGSSSSDIRDPGSSTRYFFRRSFSRFSTFIRAQKINKAGL
jgi:hypothetical protein